jgi:hypothetical protein
MFRNVHKLTVIGFSVLVAQSFHTSKSVFLALRIGSLSQLQVLRVVQSFASFVVQFFELPVGPIP